MSTRGLRARGVGVFAIFAAAFMMGLAGCTKSPEARRDAFLAHGKELVQKQDYSRAMLEFRNAARAVPKDPDPYYQLALAALAAGDPKSAVGALRQALNVDPKHVASRLKLAQLMAETSDPGVLADAENRLKEIKDQDKTDSEVVTALAFTELKLGKPVDAAENLEEVLARSPQAISSSILLARAKIMQHDLAGAEEVLKKASAAAPREVMPLVALGDFYYFQSRLGDAEKSYGLAMGLDGKNELPLARLSKLEYFEGKKQESEAGFKRLSQMPDKSYEPLYGLFLLQEGRQSDAAQEFERLAKQNPSDRGARTRLVLTYLRMNRTSDAKRVLGEALKSNPKDLDALLQRSEMELKAGEYGEAKADVDRVVSLQPNSAQAHWVKAELFKAEASELSYRQELEEALRLGPALLAVRIELAQAFVAASQPAAAMDVLNTAPRSQKQTTAFQVQRNWALWAAGDMAEMRKGIDTGLAIERTPDLLVQDGLWKSRSGDLAGARAVWGQALKDYPASLVAATAMSDSFLTRKNTPEAVRIMTQFAAQQPKSAKAQNLLGEMLLLNRQNKEARVAFESAKTLDPQLVDTEMNLIQLDVLDGNLENAKKGLRNVLSQHPGDATAMLWLANLETAGGDYSAAIEHFQRVLDEQPDNLDALNNLAYLLADSGKDFDRALKLAQRAVELSPDKGSYSDTLGWVLYHKGLYSSAATYLERANSAPQSKPLFLYHLAMAHAKAGDKVKARSELQTALQKDPNLPEAQLARQVVESTN